MCWSVERVEREGVAWFRVTGTPSGTDAVWRDTPERALHVVEFLAIQAMVQHPRCPPSLHAALLSCDGKGVALVGPGEAGKSTLAAGLWQSGFDFLGDDIVLLSTADTGARSVPRRVSLRAPSRHLLGDDLWSRIERTPSYVETTDGAVFHPSDLTPGPADTSLKLIVFLGRRGAASTEIPSRLNPAEALMALLPYSNRATNGDPGPAIRALSPLCDRVPAYDLSRAPLPQMIAAVRRLQSL